MYQCVDDKTHAVLETLAMLGLVVSPAAGFWQLTHRGYNSMQSNIRIGYPRPIPQAETSNKRE
eukprot:8578082-Karenia_brevis.AAC.1